MREPIPGSREIVPGFWRWTAYHEEWKEEVGCMAIDCGKELILVDPLLADDAAWRALERDDRRVSIVLTIFYHERSACEILDRRPGTALWAPDVDADQLACTATRRFAPGERLPGELEPLATARRDEVVLWHPDSGTVIPGDVILGDGEGGLRLCPQSWLDGATLDELADTLAPLLEMPLERVLVSHRAPVLENARESLLRALEAARAGADPPYRP